MARKILKLSSGKGESKVNHFRFQPTEFQELASCFVNTAITYRNTLISGFDFVNNNFRTMH